MVFKAKQKYRGMFENLEKESILNQRVMTDFSRNLEMSVTIISLNLALK